MFRGATGLAIAADVGGDPSGPPVILLHGGGQTRHSWGTAFRALAAVGFHVINLDARGHGDSAWAPDGDYTLPALAADLQAVVAGVGEERVDTGCDCPGLLPGYGRGLLRRGDDDHAALL